jgi:hypothetical protein
VTPLLLAAMAGVVLGVALVVSTLRRTAATPDEAGGRSAATLVGGVVLAAVCGAVVAALTAPPHVAPPAPPPAAPQPVPPRFEAHGGRALRVDPGGVAAGRAVVWQSGGLQASVPDGWVVRQSSQSDLDLRDPASTTYLTAHATPLPAGPDVGEYLRAHVDHAKEELAAGRVAGYATKTLGRVAGVVVVAERPADATWTIAWTGFEPATVSAVSITIVLGAAAADFERLEPQLGAMLDSVRID